MDEVGRLKKELEYLRNKRKKQDEIKKLKQNIKAEKFAQTTGGKIFGAIGKVLSSPPQKKETPMLTKTVYVTKKPTSKKKRLRKKIVKMIKVKQENPYEKAIKGIDSAVGGAFKY